MKKAFLLLILLAPAVGMAQTYSLDWTTVDGGGGTSTGGVYAVSGTIGQPDAGTMSDGTYTLDGGFWSLIATVQTPGAPPVDIVVSGPGQAMIYWSPDTPGFVLQETLTLSPSAWSTPPAAPTIPSSSPPPRRRSSIACFRPQVEKDSSLVLGISP